MSDEKYIYEGWNVVAKYDLVASNWELGASYTWGLDLSGSMQGAGGVGGLLSIKDGADLYYYTYDANGNVSEVLDENGDIAAHYEYTPFGETYVATGPYATTNEYRFSTKPLDAVSGLYYYGYRFYNPSTGRWPSRDPIEERGGTNLYAFLRNNGLHSVDRLGLTIIRVDGLYNQTLTNTGTGQDGYYEGVESYNINFYKVGCSVTVIVTLTLTNFVSQDVIDAWRTGVSNVWNVRAKVCCRCKCPSGMPITVTLNLVPVAFNPNGEVNPIPDDGVNIPGVGDNQVNWTTNLAEAPYTAAHEIGHYLGNRDQYGTVDGVDHGPGNNLSRGIMNNPYGYADVADFGNVLNAINNNMPDAQCSLTNAFAYCP